MTPLPLTQLIRKLKCRGIGIRMGWLRNLPKGPTRVFVWLQVSCPPQMGAGQQSSFPLLPPGLVFSRSAPENG